MNKFLCFMFGGHKYRVVQHFSHTSRRIKCDRCKGDWGMNDSVQAFLPWDSEMEEMYHRFQPGTHADFKYGVYGCFR